MKIGMWALVALLVGVGTAEAQQESFASPGLTQREYAQAIKSCAANPAVFTRTCGEILEDYSRRLGANFKDMEDLATTIGLLDQKPCEGDPSAICLYDKMRSNLVVVKLGASSTSGRRQARGLPYTRMPIDLRELAAALESNDQSVLYGDCGIWVETYNTIIKPEQPVGSCSEMAEIVRGYNVAPCPVGVEASFTTIQNGKANIPGLTRECRPGEQWAYDNNLGLWVFSLLCGNFITKTDLPMPRQQTEVVADAPTQPETPPSLRDQAEAAGKELADQNANQGPSKSKPIWHWDRKSGKVIWVTGISLAGAGIYCAVSKECFVNINRNYYQPK